MAVACMNEAETHQAVSRASLYHHLARLSASVTMRTAYSERMHSLHAPRDSRRLAEPPADTRCRPLWCEIARPGAARSATIIPAPPLVVGSIGEGVQVNEL